LISAESFWTGKTDTTRNDHARISTWLHQLLRHRIDTGDCVYSGCAMRQVTEQEINQAVTISDVWAGIAVGAIMGLVFYGALLVGIG
jgi:hypothetical protein